MGSVFSPYYAWSGRKDPLDHCAVNVALYGPGRGRWAMTERRRPALHRTAATLAIGPSALAWDGDGLTVSVEETTVPWPSRLSGTIRLRPRAISERAFALDARGGHIWRPIAARADVEIDFAHPGLRWRGEGYFDTNAGDAPLEQDFRAWDWSRAHRKHDTVLFYDVARTAGDDSGLSLRIGPGGEVEPVEPPPRVRLPSSAWRVARATRGEADDPPKVRRTLEDTPFYVRSALEGGLFGEPSQIVHESLSLARFNAPLVRAMLPFRMPRVFW